MLSRQSLTGEGQARAGSQPHGMSPTRVKYTRVHARAPICSACHSAPEHLCFPVGCGSVYMEVSAVFHLSLTE